MFDVIEPVTASLHKVSIRRAYTTNPVVFTTDRHLLSARSVARNALNPPILGIVPGVISAGVSVPVQIPSQTPDLAGNYWPRLQ